MAYKARAPRLGTGAARKSDHVGTAIAPSNIIPQTSVQDIVSAVVAERYRLPAHLARLVCELAQIGGRFA